MSITIEIPGGYAELREKLNKRRARAIERAQFGAMAIIEHLPPEVREQIGSATDASALTGLSVSPEDAALLYDASSAADDAAIVAYLESWTLEQPLPSTPEEASELEEELYDALVSAIAKVRSTEGAEGVNFEIDGPTPDPESPTPGSSDSASL